MVIDQSKATELQIIGCTGQHLGDRKEQQDRVAIFTGRNAPRCVLALLADGVGGRSGGSIASENVLVASQKLFDEFNPEKDSHVVFFNQLVAEIHATLRISAYASKTDPHSTVVALLLQPDQAHWCHVGDSRLYHFRQGSLISRTEDHTFAAKMILEGTMSVERALLHPSAQHLVNTLGGAATPTAAIQSISNLRPGDRFLLCSDGLWAHFGDAELGDAIAGTDLKAASLSLIQEARNRAAGQGDNCSMIILGVEARP